VDIRLRPLFPDKAQQPHQRIFILEDATSKELD